MEHSKPRSDGRKLDRSFYLNDALTVARSLIGKRLVRVIKGSRLSAMIVETEAYLGERDLACHACKGMTRRTRILYETGGHAYVYLIYGMYELFNVVVAEKGNPEVVLIRAVEPETGLELMKENYAKANPPLKLTNGPGKFTKAMNITRELYGHDLLSDDFFIEEHLSFDDAEIVRSKRIGITHGGEWKDKEFRFHLKGNPYVSKQ